MIFAALATLRALLRACGPEPSQDGVPTPGGEDDVAARHPQDADEPVGQGDAPRPPTDDLVGAPAAYIMPTTLPYTNPSKIARCCARCRARHDLDAYPTRKPIDLFWVGAELLCAPCATTEGADITLDRVARA